MATKLFLTLAIALIIWSNNIYSQTIKVGVYGKVKGYSASYAVNEIIDALNKHKGIEARIINTFAVNKKTLLKYDVVVLCSPRIIPQKVLLAAYIENGYGVLFINNFYVWDDGRHEHSLFPDIWQLAGTGDKKGFIVVKTDHPVTKGLPRKLSSSYDTHIQLTAGRNGEVLIKDADGKAIVVAGKMGKGKVLAIGNIFAPANTTEKPRQRYLLKDLEAPKEKELALLVNGVRWLAEGRSKEKAIWADRKTLFRDITKQAGVECWGCVKCICWGDIDGDGYIDLFIAMGRASNRLFHNNGDGTFLEISETMGIGGGKGGSHGAAIVDLNNDRSNNNDLFVANHDYRSLRLGPQPNNLYINCGGCWVDRAKDAGVAIEQKEPEEILNASSGVAIGDIDHDGKLDIYLSGGGGKHCRKKNYVNNLFRQVRAKSYPDVNIMFEDITDKAGLVAKDSNETAYICALVDLDNDGWLDIYRGSYSAAKGTSLISIFHNNGDATFMKITEKTGVKQQGKNVACAFGDFNNDGYIDLYIGNGDGKNKLYQNNGKGVFKDVTVSAKLKDTGEARETRGAIWGDIDNDGYLDLYVAGFPGKLFLNKGNRTFKEIAIINSGLYAPCGHGCAFGDMDNDGRLDLYIGKWEDTTIPDSGNCKLFRNEIENNNHYLKILVKGSKKGTNLSAVGAKVYVYKAGHCGDRKYLLGYRQVLAGGMFSSGPLIQHFGLGREKKVDIEVVYPTTGKTVKKTGVLCDQTVTVFEPKGKE